ncbi:hypothetical protein OIU77_012262, partial [Salix suchowensis]
MLFLLPLARQIILSSDFSISLQTLALGIRGYVSCRYMVVFQYGSAVLF